MLQSHACSNLTTGHPSVILYFVSSKSSFDAFCKTFFIQVELIHTNTANSEKMLLFNRVYLKGFSGDFL